MPSEAYARNTEHVVGRKLICMHRHIAVDRADWDVFRLAPIMAMGLDRRVVHVGGVVVSIPANVATWKCVIVVVVPLSGS